MTRLPPLHYILTHLHFLYMTIFLLNRCEILGIPIGNLLFALHLLFSYSSIELDRPSRQGFGHG